jgi:hypothetical protein
MADKTPVNDSAESPPKPSSTAASHSLWTDCAESFLEPALQKPVTALAQAVDLVGGTHLAEKSQFVAAPKEKSYGSAGWLAQEIAGGAGSAVPYVLTALAVRPLIKGVVGNALLKTGLSADTVVGITGFAETTASGFGTGAIFNPSADIHSFWSGRVNNGITSGATMASLHLLSNGLGKYNGASAMEAGIGIKALNTGVAGLGAGAVSAETQSYLTTGHSASFKDVTKSAISMSITGGVLGAAGDGVLRLNQLRSSFPDIQNHVVNRGGDRPAFDNYFKHQAGKSFDHMSPIGRVDFITEMERQARSPLVRPEPMAAFIAKMQDVGSNWSKDDISTLTERARQADIEYQAKCKEVSEAQRELSRKYSGARIIVDNDGKILHEDAPEWKVQEKALNEEIFEASRSTRVHRDALQQIYDRRGQEISAVVNEFLQAHDLPTVSIRPELALPGGASADYAVGELGLDYDVIKSADLSDTTTGIIFHELVHLEQDNLRIRNFADKMDIGRNPTPAQIDKLTERAFPLIRDESVLRTGDVEKVFGFVERVLALRDGKPLSRAEAQRAEKLADGVERYKAPWTDSAEKTYIASFEVQKLLGSDKPDSLDSFLTRMRESPEFYGFSTVPRSLDSFVQQAYERTAQGQIEKRNPPLILNPRLSDLLREPTGPKDKAENHGKNVGGVPLDRAAVSQGTAPAETSAAPAEQQFSSSRWMTTAEQTAVRSVLSNHLSALKAQADRFAARSSRWYLNNALEQEAFPSGLLMQFMVERRHS